MNAEPVEPPCPSLAEVNYGGDVSVYISEYIVPCGCWLTVEVVDRAELSLRPEAALNTKGGYTLTLRERDSRRVLGQTACEESHHGE